MVGTARLGDRRWTVGGVAAFLSGVVAAGDPDTFIDGVAVDSRRVRPGDLFVALPGARTDGRAYAAQARARGAVAVVSDRLLDGIPVQVVAPDPRGRLAALCAAFHGNPERTLSFVGVTGTNGKTTTAFLIRSVLERAGRRTGIIGTVFYGFPEERRPAPLTTPDPALLYAELARLREKGARTVVMEVSSHALVQGRVAGIRFDAAAFTNLTRDHLDYHPSFAAYRDAKGLLFASLPPDSCAVLNAQDPQSAHYRGLTRGRVITYGVGVPADVCGRILAASFAGTDLAIEGAAGSCRIRLPLLGGHNAANALAAAAVSAGLGIDPEAIAGGLEAAPPVPGRLEKVSGDAPATVLVDYAHTDDALRSVLRTLRDLGPRRLVVLFGCGGDRDRGKRPLMGRVAEEMADAVFLTSDNPRSEDPLAILADIQGGMTGRRPTRVIPDRREAIAAAVRDVRPGDCLLIAGKGHESVQIVGDRMIPFDDREETRAALAAAGRPAGDGPEGGVA